MNKNARVLALKIALLIEENTKKDIAEAIEFLSENNSDKNILVKILKLSASNNSRPSEKFRRSEPLSAQRRLHIETDIHKEGKGKDDIIKEIERLLKNNIIFKSKEALNRFGSQINKSFDSNQTRGDAVESILESMRNLRIEELRKIIKIIIPTQSNSSDTGYQSLAKFLIEGKKEQS